MTKRQVFRTIIAIAIWTFLFLVYLSVSRVVPIDFAQGTLSPSEWLWRKISAYLVYGALFVGLPILTLTSFPNKRLGRITLTLLWIMYLLLVPMLVLGFFERGTCMPASGLLLYISAPFQFILYLVTLILVTATFTIGERGGFFVGAFLFLFTWLFPMVPLYTFNHDLRHYPLSESIVRAQRWFDLRCPDSMDITNQPSLFAKCRGFTQEKQTALAFMEFERSTFLLVVRQLLDDIPATQGEYKRRAIFQLQELQGKSPEFDKLLQGELAFDVLKLLCHYPDGEIDQDLESEFEMIFEFYKENPGLPKDCPVWKRFFERK